MDFEEALKILREIKSEASKNPEYGFYDDWINFIQKMQFLSPKAFGTRIQNRIILKNEFEKVNASIDQGDFKINNEYYEFKVSILTPSNKLANFVNIRPYQDITGYYCVVVNTLCVPYKTYQFKLSKDQMNNEIKILNASFANGTKKANLENKNPAYRFSIDFINENKNGNRWINIHKTSDLKL